MLGPRPGVALDPNPDNLRTLFVFVPSIPLLPVRTVDVVEDPETQKGKNATIQSQPDGLDQAVSNLPRRKGKKGNYSLSLLTHTALSLIHI